jgi:hypothetical protein
MLRLAVVLFMGAYSIDLASVRVREAFQRSPARRWLGLERDFVVQLLGGVRPTYSPPSSAVLPMPPRCGGVRRGSCHHSSA